MWYLNSIFKVLNSFSKPRSVLDSSYLKSHEVPSYEVAEKKLKKQRAVINPLNLIVRKAALKY